VIFATSVWNLLVDAAGTSTTNNTHHWRTYEEEFSHGDRKDHEDFSKGRKRNG
jgi:hypothetical protein